MLQILKNKNSIIYKLTVNLLILSFLFLITLVVININLTKNNYTQAEKEKIEVIVNSVVNSLSINISFELFKAVDETLETMITNKNILLVKLKLYSTNQEKIYTLDNDTQQISLADTFVKVVDINAPTNNDMIATLTLYYSKQHYINSMNTYYAWLSLAIFFYLFMIFLFIRFLIKNIKPFHTVAKQMNSFDPQNPKKIDFHSIHNDEIKLIVNTTNNMIDTITTHIEETDQKNKLIFEQSKLVSMGEMIGNIAHQWRQPLSVISTASTGLIFQKQLNTLEESELIKTCNMINDNAQYLSKTIDDFRDFIKGDRSKIEFNLNKNIESFLHLVEGTIKNNDLELILELDENITTYGYPNELIQCLLNIFSNAKDALIKTQGNKYIFIKTSQDTNWIHITITDNGGGIKEDIIQRVFEPYFTTKHQTQGTGLGLNMTYNLIVDGMDGKIEVKNMDYKYNGINYTGAEFRISLPVK